MPRGEASEVGTERWSQNGYLWVKTVTGWRLHHHIVAEEALGRKIDPAKEQVRFKDGDKKNFDPNNLEVIPKHKARERRQVRVLTGKIGELQKQLDYYQSQASSTSELIDN